MEKKGVDDKERKISEVGGWYGEEGEEREGKRERMWEIDGKYIGMLSNIFFFHLTNSVA